MNRADPPHIATWILEHWALGDHKDALAGDLLEQFRSGRSGRARAWYWRQVFAAIASGCIREILSHRNVMLFAVLWSMVSPAWVVLSTNTEVHSRAFGLMWQMDWPWSSICAIALSFSTSLFFIWSGMALYLIPRMSASQSFNMRTLVRSLLRALPMFVAIAAVPFAMSLFFHAGHGQGIDRRTLTPLNALTDLRLWAVVERLFNLPILLYGLWRTNRLLREGPEGLAR
jgi:hypothetical protein